MYVLTITRPDGSTEKLGFTTSERAQEYASDIMFSMDTSEVRETMFEIGRLS